MNINQQIQQSLLKINPFTEEQVQLFLEKVKIQSFSKNEYLLTPPKICKFTAIVLQGSFRMFRRTEEREHTLNFFTENEWVGDFESFVVQQPTVNFIQAMEKAEVAIISLQEIHQLIARDNFFLRLGRIMKEWSVSAHLHTSLIDDKPEVRYQALLARRPDWILRFPQMHLAAYLGMSRETFSRIKRKNLCIY